MSKPTYPPGQRYRDAVNLLKKYNLLDGFPKILHVAPSKHVQDYIKSHPNVSYTAIDLNDSKAGTGYTGTLDVCGDITKLDEIFKEGEFDGLICSHVLEHIEDDHLAIAQLSRVLKPDGWAIIQVPQAPAPWKTYEDPSITSPEERKKRFGQWNHVRKYGCDFTDRLKPYFTIEDKTWYLCRKITDTK